MGALTKAFAVVLAAGFALAAFVGEQAALLPRQKDDLSPTASSHHHPESAVRNPDGHGARFESAMVDPLTGAMLGLKLFGLAAKVTASMLMAKTTADIEMQSAQLDEIKQDMKRKLARVQKLLDDATGDAQVRMFDAINAAGLALIKAAPEAQVAALYATVFAGDASTATPQRDQLLQLMQTEYDALLGLDGRSKKKQAQGGRLLSSMAPTLADLQDVMAPQSEDTVKDKLATLAINMQKKSPGGDLLLNVPRALLDQASDGLHEAVRAAKAAHAVTSKNALGGSRADLQNIGRVAQDAADQAQEYRKMDKESIDAIKDTSGELWKGENAAYGVVESGGTDEAAGEPIMGFASNDVAKNFIGVADKVFGAEESGKMLEGLAAASAIVDFGKNIFAAYEILRRGEQKFIVRRNVGIARENLKDMTREAIISTCRLLHLLYDQLRAFSAIESAQVPDMPWEKLLAADTITTGMGKEALRSLRVAIHSKMCDAFAPLRKRVGALFRNRGKCMTTQNYYSQKDVAALRTKLTAATGALTDDSTTSSVTNCNPLDIMDIRLTVGLPKERKWLEDLGYTLVNSKLWPAGELNAELSVNLLRRIAKDGAVGATVTPLSSRVLMYLTCAALKTSMKDHPDLVAGNPDIVIPITDLKVVVRPANGYSQQKLDASGNVVRDGIDRSSEEEKSLLKSGYSLVTFDRDPAAADNRLALSRSRSVPVHTPLKAEIAASWSSITSWWSGKTFQYSHSDPSDLKNGRSEDFPALYVYTRRGGPSPLVGLSLLPFAPTKYQTGKVQDATLMSDFRKVWGAKNGAKEPEVEDSWRLSQPDVAVPDSTVRCTNEVDMEGCAPVPVVCSETLSMTLKGYKEESNAGVVNRLGRVLTHRAFQAWSGAKTDETALSFELSCEGISETPYRWRRVPVSPYEGTDMTLVQPYLWQLKRYIVVPLPDTSQKLRGCPDVCNLRKTNAYIAESQKADVEVSSN